ncbi:MAG: hypothetical protein MUF57_05965 [Gammaproteobacteria bacterium]|nr:hypothetical protein [Gammaproteobacteria bacterium]
MTTTFAAMMTPSTPICRTNSTKLRCSRASNRRWLQVLIAMGMVTWVTVRPTRANVSHATTHLRSDRQ